LKQTKAVRKLPSVPSPPARGRGLKLTIYIIPIMPTCRPPRGGVD